MNSGPVYVSVTGLSSVVWNSTDEPASGLSLTLLCGAPARIVLPSPLRPSDHPRRSLVRALEPRLSSLGALQELPLNLTLATAPAWWFWLTNQDGYPATRVPASLLRATDH